MKSRNLKTQTVQKVTASSTMLASTASASSTPLTWLQKKIEIQAKLKSYFAFTSRLCHTEIPYFSIFKIFFKSIFNLISCQLMNLL